jgi:hypothetical protein
LIVLVLVAVLWIAVLVPTAVSKLRERRSAESIGRFHQRLDLLERTGPKLVEPAYRLTASGSTSAGHDPVVVAAPPPPVRPNLTLVPAPVEEDSEMEEEFEMPEFAMEDSFGAEITEIRFETEETEDEIELDQAAPDRHELAALNRRRAARRRRRNIFGMLCALTAFAGLLGLAPPLRVFWYVAATFFALLVGFVGLAAYGQRLEAERAHLSHLQRVRGHQSAEEDQPSAIVKYLSADELDRYREALAGSYEEEAGRLAAGG